MPIEDGRMRFAHPQSSSSSKTPDARRAGLCRALVAALVFAIFPAGCAHAPGPQAGPAPARVRIQNLSDHAWRVALDPANGPAGELWELGPRAEHVAMLPAGEYRLRRALADNPAAVASSGGEGDPIRLEAGGSYTWPLAMLLSEQEEGRGP